ncbi:MAG: serine/threonine-protein kinase [Pyrinomonadaceae bacterium]|nr:serine/threonine-protein kinase [Pyrinomonadaceae bacterium]
MIGQTVSHYRIVEKLGEGAMGVVYLAEDTHLGRHVAIKFLTDSQDHRYRARFIREARAVSTISHPHIAVIHDYGETTEGQPFIVLEYIKGETLSDLLHESKLTITEAVEVIEAVGEAMGAAHARGIIHRDIKPSNVLVNKEGEVKVLDFGLVKHLHEDHPQGAGPDANTLLARTSSNVIIGTPLYLSPEQALGADVDARSDLFALGALLYESLTGRPAFSGGSVIEIGAQIIHFNPLPPSSVNKRVPPELDRITLKALAKKPESRYQTAGQMVADLRATRNALDNEDGHRTQRLVASKPSHSSAFKSISESLRRPRLSIGFFVFALLSAVAGALYIFPPHPEKGRVPFQNMPVTKVTNTGKSLTAEVSPDGKYIAQVLGDAGQQSLVSTYPATASNVLIAPPADVRYHAISFSNDGNYIYYVRYEKTEIGLLYQVPAHGGASRKILSNVDSKITFAPDGKRFAFVRWDKSKGEYSLMIAQSDGTGERRLVMRSNPDLFSIYGLAWSPNGEVIACLDGSFTGGFHMRVVEVRVADGTEKPVTSRNWFGVTRVVWLKDGSGMLVTAAEESVSPIQIWYVSYPEGKAQRVTNDSNNYRDLSLTADSRTLVSVQHSRLATMWIAPTGDSARATQITSGVGWSYGLAWIPNNRIVYSTMASGKLDLWSMGSDGADKTQLTSDAGSNYHPTVSSDGRYIFFSSSRFGPFNIWRMDTDGNNPRQLTDGGSDIYPYPTPDGHWVIYQRGGGGGGKPTLWKVPVDGGHAVQIRDANFKVPVVSPDGKMIACRYLDETSNIEKIAIIPSDGGPPVKVFNIPIFPWQRIRWTHDGSALTYVDVRSGISNIWSQPLDGGPPRQVTDFRADQIFSFDWSHDGKQLVCERGVETNDVVLISDYK